MSDNPDDDLLEIGLRALADFILDVNILPRKPIPGTGPITCPVCRTRCFDLNPDIHKAHCPIAAMLRRANKRQASAKSLQDVTPELTTE